MLQCVAVCYSMLRCVAVRCSALQCVAVRCSVMQCVAVCCSVRRIFTLAYLDRHAAMATVHKHACMSICINIRITIHIYIYICTHEYMHKIVCTGGHVAGNRTRARSGATDVVRGPNW